MRITIHVDTNPPERERFTGRTLVAIKDPKRPGTDIRKLLEAFEGKMAQEFAGDIGVESFVTEAVWPSFGAAVLRSSTDVTRAFVDEMLHIGDAARTSVDQLSHSPEHFLYPPLAVDLPPDPTAPSSREILSRMGVTERHSGNVGVLILDTGFEHRHPDFRTRGVTPESFVFGEPGGEDRNGHGTHCAGLACGPRRPQRAPRYGVAPDATLLAGRIFSRTTGSAVDSAVLDALERLKNTGVAVVNMSFGVNVREGDLHSEAFELAANRALMEHKMVLIASAGNDPTSSQQPVEHPANCPSVVAVAALDRNFQPAAFSCVGLNPGQEVDVAAPGYLVQSAFKGAYRKLSGTSMSAALVTGVTALWAASDSSLRGGDLRNEVIGSGQLGVAALAGGTGLVKAPPI